MIDTWNILLFMSDEGEYVVFLEPGTDYVIADYQKDGYDFRGEYRAEISHIRGSRIFTPGEGDCYMKE